MPTRPRTHVLETESLIEFQRRLPSRWIFRPEQIDYGIDGSVEIVTEDGRVSGERFYVQLKATDEEDENQAFTVRLSVDTAEYYGKLQLPLLMVRYWAPRRLVLFRWFHNRDPYYDGVSGKSIPFRFAIEDKWREGTAAALAKEVDGWRWSRQRGHRLPVAFTLKISGRNVIGFDALELAQALEIAVRPIFDVIRVSEVASADSIGEIDITAARSIARLPAGNSCTLHTEQPPPNYSLAAFAADVLLLIAIVLDRAGEARAATRILDVAGLNSSLLATPEMASRLGDAYVRSGQAVNAIRYANRLLEAGRPVHDAQQLLLSPLLSLDKVPAEEMGGFEEELRKWTSLNDRYGHQTERAAAHYNLGRFLGYRARNVRCAVSEYRNARRIDSAYASRAYFWNELGAIAFEAGRPLSAVRFYRAAIGCGSPEPDALARLADALTSAGRYAEAQEEFDRYRGMTAAPLPHWILKALVLPMIRKYADQDSQRRKTLAASVEISHAETCATDDEREVVLREVLKLDALSGLAWFNLGLIASRKETSQVAFWLFATAATIQPWDVEAWALALLMVLGRPDSKIQPDEFGLFFIVAYARHDGSLIRELLKRVDGQVSADVADTMAQVLRNLASTLPARARPKEIRIIDSNHKAHVIRIDN